MTVVGTEVHGLLQGVGYKRDCVEISRIVLAGLLESERRDFWLAKAEEWGQRALDEIAFHFRESNGAVFIGAATKTTSSEGARV
jgi:hypothetical protein